MKLFLTYDIGTTAVKAALFSQDLQCLSLVIHEYTLETPGPDLVELDANVYWEEIQSATKELLKKSDANAQNIVSITCTTQGETLIPVDENNEPLCNAVVWLDARAKAQSLRLQNIYSKEVFYDKTGIPEISPYVPLAKLLWFQEEAPTLYAKTHKFLLVEDYILCKLTGCIVTNSSLICTTGYWNLVNNSLWNEVLETTGLQADKIPDVLAPGSVVGTILSEVARELGLPQNVIVTTGAMDQVAMALGAGNITPGRVTETTGTCLAVGMTKEIFPTGNWSPVPVYSHYTSALFFQINVMQTAGIVLKWFRDEFCQECTFDQMSDLAATVPPLSKGVMLFPYFQGTSANPEARGSFVGLSLETNRACLIRSILEGVGYMLKESLELLSAEPGEIYSLGGGSKSNIWNQIKSDICDCQIRVLDVPEGALLGAAILGALAIGEFEDITKAMEKIKPGRLFTQSENTELYKSGYKQYKEGCAWHS
jgi:xylulokinase